MSQSLLYHAFGVREGYEYVRTEYPHGTVEFHLAVADRLLLCPHCQSRELIRKGKRFRRLQTVPIGLKPVWLVTEGPRCQCRGCGRGVEVAPPFAPAYVHYPERLSRDVGELSRGMTLADVSALTGLGWDTVKEIVAKQLQHDYGQPRLKDLKLLAIDEIHVGKRQKFYTLVLDLETGQIVWVGHGRGPAALGKFWRRLRLSKAKIHAVAMDLSGAYWAAGLEHLPGVAVVFDRFHLSKLMNAKLDELRRALGREATGALRQTIKGTRYLLLTRAAHLTEGQRPKLEDALKLNEPLSNAYYLKEELSLLWEQPSRAAMESFLRQWCERARATGIGLLRKMAKTLRLHASGILSWWEHRINSGKREGVHNKIKTLTRRAYGYRDEAFFILKLLALQQAQYKLVG